MTTKSISEAASQLGKLGKGKPKTLSDAERKRRSLHMQAVTRKRVADRKLNKPLDTGTE